MTSSLTSPTLQAPQAGAPAGWTPIIGKGDAWTGPSGKAYVGRREPWNDGPAVNDNMVAFFAGIPSAQIVDPRDQTRTTWGQELALAPLYGAIDRAGVAVATEGDVRARITDIFMAYLGSAPSADEMDAALAVARADTGSAWPNVYWGDGALERDIAATFGGQREDARQTAQRAAEDAANAAFVESESLLQSTTAAIQRAVGVTEDTAPLWNTNASAEVVQSISQKPAVMAALAEQSQSDGPPLPLLALLGAALLLFL